MNDAVRAILAQLAGGGVPGKIPADVECSAELQRLTDYHAAIQRFAIALGNGDLSASLQGCGGPVAAGLKSLQASLRHLAWQTRQIAAGDLNQRVDFMGDFASSFNSMVAGLAVARCEMERMNERLQEELLLQQALADALRENEERLRLITEKVNAVIWTMDSATLRFTYVGPYITKLRGLTVEEALAETLADSLTPASLVRVKERMARNNDRFMETGDVTSFFDNIEVEQVCSDGRPIQVEMVISAITDNEGKLKEFIGISRDITARKIAEEKLTYLSNHDSLTGLYNRTFFDVEVERAVLGRSFPLGIIIADLDGLKQINDTLGHAAGDRFIKGAATVLRMAFRGDDIVARIGGDEFVVLLHGMGAEEVAVALTRIRECEENFNRTHDGPALRISLGSATALNGAGVAQALREADARMYAEKALRKRLQG